MELAFWLHDWGRVLPNVIYGVAPGHAGKAPFFLQCPNSTIYRKYFIVLRFSRRNDLKEFHPLPKGTEG